MTYRGRNSTTDTPWNFGSMGGTATTVAGGIESRFSALARMGGIHASHVGAHFTGSQSSSAPKRHGTSISGDEGKLVQAKNGERGSSATNRLSPESGSWHPYAAIIEAFRQLLEESIERQIFLWKTILLPHSEFAGNTLNTDFSRDGGGVFTVASTTSTLFSKASTYDAIQSAVLNCKLTYKYYIELDPLFSEAGYEVTEPYEDGCGGLIIDFINPNERISFALDEDGIEIFYMESGEFRSEYFANPWLSERDVIEFLKSRIA